MPILDWAPLVWGVRLLLVLGVLIAFGAGALVLVYVAQFFRPSQIRAVWRSGIPEFKSWNLVLSFLGSKIGLNTALDTERDEQLRVIQERLAEVEGAVARLVATDRHLVSGGESDAEEE